VRRTGVAGQRNPTCYNPLTEWYDEVQIYIATVPELLG
jgi:hypothetical protein